LFKSFKASFRWKKKYKKTIGRDTTLLLLLAISIGISTTLFLLGFLTLTGILTPINEFITGLDLIVFGMLCLVGPIGFYNHIKEKHRKEVEEKLPDFLRDIANSTSSGMTIFDAIRSASTGDYGSLTPELKRMASKLSWGISIKEALTDFAERINTDRARRLAITINKALEIGGNTSSVFNAAAREIDQIKRVEQQRKTEMSLYSIVIFISFFVFLAVILIIDKTIFAAIFDMQGRMAGQSIGNMRISQITPEELKNMFYIFVFVQGLGGGMLGGFMMDGRLSSGIRYSFVLILVSFILFKFLF